MAREPAKKKTDPKPKKRLSRNSANLIPLADLNNRRRGAAKG